MTFTKYKDSIYRSSGKPYSVKQIVNMIKEDRPIKILDELGNDETHEFMIKAAFGSHLTKPYKKEEFIVLDILCKKITKDEAEDIIFAGGIESYLMRERMNKC